MDTIDLPSSVYQPYEEDYGFWSDGILPNVQVKKDTERQLFPNGMDFSAYSDPLPMSDFSGSGPIWDEPQLPFTEEVMGTQLVQDEMRRHVASLVY
jgi:hypothetical protein